MQIIGWLSASKGRPFGFNELVPLMELEAPSKSLSVCSGDELTGTWRLVREWWWEARDVGWILGEWRWWWNRRRDSPNIFGGESKAWFCMWCNWWWRWLWLPFEWLCWEDGGGDGGITRALGGDRSWWLRIEGGEFEDVSEDVGDEEEVASNLSCCWVCRCSSWWLDGPLAWCRCCLFEDEDVHFIVFDPATEPTTGPIMHSTLLLSLTGCAVEAVDPVDDKDQCLVLFAERSRHPHWSTDSAFPLPSPVLLEEVDVVDDDEFDLLWIVFAIKWWWEEVVVDAASFGDDDGM